MPRIRPLLLVFVLVLVVAPISHGAVAVEHSPASATVPDDPVRSGAVTLNDSAAQSPATGLARRVYDQQNTTSYLGVPDVDVEQSAHGTGSLDVSSAVASDAERLGGELPERSFEASLATIEDRDRRVARMNDEVAAVQQRIDALAARQQTAIDEYNDGALTTEQFLHELVVVDAAARQIGSRIDSLDQAGRQVPGSHPIWTQLQVLRAHTVPLQGTVREQVGQTIAGEGESLSVYVLTTSDGVVLSANDDEGFNHREAYLANKRQTNTADQFSQQGGSGVNLADERASELYPWTYGLAKPSVTGFPDTAVYHASADHPHGRLDAYIDGGSQDVYREIQTKRLDALPTARTSANETDLLRIQAQRTHATGPMRIAVSNPNTDDPINATVVVNGYEVGPTGSDGQVWATTPYDAVRINAVTPDGQSIRVRFFADD